MNHVAPKSSVLVHARVHAYGVVLRRVLSLKRESDVKILHNIFGKFVVVCAVVGATYASIQPAHPQVVEGRSQSCQRL